MLQRKPRALALGSLLVLSACSRPPELTREMAADLIRSSTAFTTIGPGMMMKGEERFQPGPTTKRELLRIEDLTILDDGPGGIAGRTATAQFTWRWTEGPWSNVTFHTKARLNSTGGPWKLYEDYLSRQIGMTERGETDR